MDGATVARVVPLLEIWQVLFAERTQHGVGGGPAAALKKKVRCVHAAIKIALRPSFQNIT